MRSIWLRARLDTAPRFCGLELRSAKFVCAGFPQIKIVCQQIRGTRPGGPPRARRSPTRPSESSAEWGEPMPVWGGIRMRADEIITLGGDRPIHVRTEGACRWSSIWVPAAEIVCYGSAMTGNTFSIPSAAQWWRLRPATSRCLRQLHAAAVNLVESRSTALSVAETAHGLEQQLIEGLVECLSKGRAIEAMPATTEHQDIAARFEALLQSTPGQFLPIAKICAALGVPAQMLRICCDEQLGMGPTEYARRWRMQLVHRTLLNGNTEAASISAVARRCGFRSLGSFAASYRAFALRHVAAWLAGRRAIGHSGQARHETLTDGVVVD